MYHLSRPSWRPGENCDVILQHGAHEPIPLVCYRIPSDPIGPRVKIHFETYWGDDGVSRSSRPVTVRYLWFTVLIADDVLCPNGRRYPFSPAEVRRRINDILHELTDITLYTQAGAITGLYCTEHAVIDTVYQHAHTLEIWLSTRSLKDIPIGAESVNTWLPDDFLFGNSCWGKNTWI